MGTDGFDREQMRATIKGGSVFYFVEDSFQTDKPHYFVVLNRQPLKDDGIAFVCAVTLDIRVIERCEKRGLKKSTLVDVTPVDCLFLRYPSLFDCNEVILKPFSTMVSRLEKQELRCCGDVSEEVLARLRFGVRSSRLVSGKVKKMLS